MSALTVEPLPEDAPAILTYIPPAAGSLAETVARALRELEAAAVELFPAWLPGAEGIEGPGGASVIAVRTLALRAASTSRHFGPFLADLAESALRGVPVSSRFTPEVRAAGLARVLASGFGRSQAAILVRVPERLSASEEDVLVAACEWLAARGGFGVWLAGDLTASADRVEPVTLRFPGRDGRISPRWSAHPVERAIVYPAVSGSPHPGSKAEKTLEKALASRPWAQGRAWNQTYRSHPLTNPIRVDLLWHDERCAVEIDGEEHLKPDHFAADRQRDVRLQLDGYAVLRFTNTQVLTDVEKVVGQLEQFLQGRRNGLLEGKRHG
ncbi:DUF559 domain-containing protein [Sphaerisporangium album]|uniref:DUF559 domain-containing protein n=1 Tax=Sphaerisporangium album TaxID=509200 RepID=A0A367F7C1_9ACTN|nr:DUF559 domain-containing protein [Sphaerisporangium album]RCG26264.1 DUF559 domain-containing protein [Sphaerisporangium album]